MTRVSLERNGVRYSVKAIGHADTEQMCAAVSCLLYTLDGWLHNANVTIINERMEPGDACLEWVMDTDSDVWGMIEIGFLQLRQSTQSMSVEICEKSCETDAGFEKTDVTM